MRLSPTAVLKYETCPRLYYFEEVLRIRSVHQPANLVFGRVVHQCIERALRARLAQVSFDIGATFNALWTQATTETGIEYSATQSPEALAAIGHHLVTAFEAAWNGWELIPMLDTEGEPIIERKLEIPLSLDVVFSGRLDMLVFDRQGQLQCLDLKTPSQPTDGDWLTVSDQLTGYQLLLDARADQWGIGQVARLGVVELIKRPIPKRQGKGPEVREPVTVARRGEPELAAYRQKVLWTAENIAAQRFPRRTLMAHNSPCKLCALRGVCHEGDTEGWIIPEHTAVG